MAKKDKTVFLCKECDDTFPKWQGQCDSCGARNTLNEFKEPKSARNPKGSLNLSGYAGAKESVQKLNEIQTSDLPRFSTQNSEFDRVLGGGIVPSSVVLIADTPGAGKSTLTLQTLCELSHDLKSICLTGEESLSTGSHEGVSP